MRFRSLSISFSSFMGRLWSNLRDSPDRQFGVVFGVVFFLIGIILFNLGNTGYLVSLCLSFIFFLSAIAAPNILHYPNLIWLRFGKILQRLISPLIMVMIYFLFLTPYGLIIKLLGYRGQMKMKQHDEPSYWVGRSAPLEAESFKNQF